MLVNFLVLFAVIGGLTVLAGLVRALGVKRISLEFHEQPSLLKSRRHLEGNENLPKQFKEQ